MAAINVSQQHLFCSPWTSWSRIIEKFLRRFYENNFGLKLFATQFDRGCRVHLRFWLRFAVSGASENLEPQTHIKGTASLWQKVQVKCIYFYKKSASQNLGTANREPQVPLDPQTVNCQKSRTIHSSAFVYHILNVFGCQSRLCCSSLFCRLMLPSYKPRWKSFTKKTAPMLNRNYTTSQEELVLQVGN